MIPKLSINYIIPFIIKCSENTTGKMLDAGAGEKPYKKYFSKVEYESTDRKGDQTYLNDLTEIPVERQRYDTILCTQVLEHVPEPDLVLHELNRVLKTKGKLILTLPQSYHIHEAPHNYFTFTKYGIEYLLNKNGFKIVEISTQGKWYTFLADEFRSANRRNYHLLPFLFIFSEIAFPVAGYFLDVFDFRKLNSLGYNILAEKVN